MTDTESWSDGDFGAPAAPETDADAQRNEDRSLGGHASALLALVLLLTRMHL